MHPCTLDRVQGGNGARKLSLHRAMEAGPLNHAAGTQPRIFLQQFEAHIARARQALRCQLQAGLGHVPLRHLHLSGGGIHLIGDSSLREGLHHFRRFLAFHAREQRHIGRPEGPVQHGHDHHDRAGQHAQQRKLATGRHAIELAKTAGDHGGQGLCVLGHGCLFSVRSRRQTCIRMIS